jgi:Flp pilus assembly protein TadB
VNPLALGAGVGLGVALVTLGLRARRPRLADALQALDRPRPRTGERHSGHRRLASAVGVRVAAADLELVGRTPDQQALRTLGAMAALAVVPVVAAAVAALGGVTIGVAPVTLAAVAMGALGFVVPDFEVRGQARERRAVFVHALSSFLDVTAVLLAGGAGTETALHAAAALGDGWPQRRLRATLDRCRLTGQTPWEVLGDLGDRLAIDELSQLATSLQLAGEHGARVRLTLTERARALRAAQLAAVEARARAVTEQMSVPVALLAVAFMLFVGFPALWVVVGEL